MWRRVGMAALWTVAGALAVWAGGIQGLLRPVRVVSGSMADVLPGPHWEVVCRDCRFRFRCGTDFPPDQYAVCPNCGYTANPLEDAAIRPGRRVWIDRWSTRLRPPRRWEVVVAPAHQPSALGRQACRRVAG